MDAVSNNKLANTENHLKDFLQTVLSSEGIVVDIRRTFIEYNGVNRSRAFARHANRMASKGTDEKFVVIALMCYPALQWILRAQDIDKVIDELREQNADETICRMSNIQRMLESSVGCAKPQLRLEMRKVFFARCQELVDAVDDAMNKAVFLNPQSKPSKISLAMARKRRLYFAKGRSLNLQNRHRAWMGLTALLRCPLPKRRKVRLASSWRLFWQWPLLAAA